MKTRFLPVLSLVVAAALGSSVVLPAADRGTASDTEIKIKLLADALTARDTGNVAEARRLLAELQKIAPGDPSVLRLKESIDTLAAQQSTAGSAAARAGSEDARAMAERETKRIAESIAQAREVQKLARAQAQRGEALSAIATYDYALGMLQPNPLTRALIDELRAERASVEQSAGETSKDRGRRQRVAARGPFGPRQRGAATEDSAIEDKVSAEPVGASVSPEFAATSRVIEDLLLRGRSQYLGGDLAGAETTFKDVETRDPNNAEAKNFLRRIAEARLATGWLDREKTREQMLEEVSRSWQRPGVFQERPVPEEAKTGPTPLLDKLERITIPSVNFSGVELARVISTLSSISEEFDESGIAPKGVNIVLIDPQRQNPLVNITLRNLSLRRVLDFITDSVGFQYEVQLDAIVVRPGGEITNLETEFFPVSRATVIRMVAATGGAVPAAAPAAGDPFAAPKAAGAGAAPAGESDAIRAFLQQAGVNFEGTTGSNLVYDGSAMIVTQTSRNLSRIRNILARYNDVRQVEIEAKFMDVAEGVLEEMGVSWMVGGHGNPTFDAITGLPILDATGKPVLRYDQRYETQNRSLADAFSPSVNDSNLRVVIPGQPERSVSVSPPSFPGGMDLGKNAGAAAAVTTSIGSFDVEAIVRALARQTGTDLLSSPKVTVLSGNLATITVAQEFRYPESYSDIESQVGQSSAAISGGSAGVTITAGTPQDFKTRNVGVELMVTPTVEDDDYSISLDLNPRVTEFDGFVEYGGSSIAISGGTTVTVPSGFFQPIFSVREMKTKVAVWDGATVVLGGLTREEVKKVNDKVPLLGDVPLLGRLFRSEGESNQKRNLLIFVTANLVSPGGSLKKQDVRGVTPNSLFQNPTIVTPGGSVDRSPAK
jgi:general secretion pathway protein D